MSVAMGKKDEDEGAPPSFLLSLILPPLISPLDIESELIGREGREGTEQGLRE